MTFSFSDKHPKILVNLFRQLNNTPWNPRTQSRLWASHEHQTELASTRALFMTRSRQKEPLGSPSLNLGNRANASFQGTPKQSRTSFSRKQRPSQRAFKAHKQAAACRSFGESFEASWRIIRLVGECCCFRRGRRARRHWV